jgi:hypothetical protein
VQFITVLAGHNFRPTECKAALAEVRAGAEHTLRLERDPENQYDKNAVKVILTLNGDEYFIGFVAGPDAQDLSPILASAPGTVAEGHTAEVTDCRILDWTSGDKKPTILIEVSTGWEVDTEVNESEAEGDDDEDGQD